MSFLNQLKEETNITKTENQAKAYKSTKSNILDLFSLGGAARTMDDKIIIKKIIHALNEDPILATKLIFYLGDVREGQGERRFFRLALPYVLEKFDNKIKELIDLIPYYNRWDTVVELAKKDRKVLNVLVKIIKQMEALDEGKKDYLMYKWLPTETRHGKKDKFALKLAKELNMTPKQYRKMLTKNRKKLNLVETNLTNKTYNNINYSHVPSQASLKYRKAFYRHDEERYSDYLDKIINGDSKVKINTATLYPHDIVNKYNNTYWGLDIKNKDKTLEAAWKSLPNYLEGGNRNVLVMADTSGSMSKKISASSEATALEVSVAMAVYFSERLEGEFKDHFITFSYEPTLNKIAGDTLKNKLESLEEIHHANTDLEAAFNLILDTAIKNKTPQKDLPTDLLIISDMQFDQANSGDDLTNLEHIKQKFEAEGYKLPNIIFWNVCARLENVPAKLNDAGVILVSGYSPSIITYILNNETVTPYEFMLKVLNSDRYNLINEVLNKK